MGTYSGAVGGAGSGRRRGALGRWEPAHERRAGHVGGARGQWTGRGEHRTRWYALVGPRHVGEGPRAAAGAGTRHWGR